MMPRQAHSRRLVGQLLAAAMLLGAPILARAHAGADLGGHHGLAQGFMHPFTGIDHLAAMLAVGFWSVLAAPGRRGAQALIPASFLVLLLAGAWLARSGMPPMPVEPLIAVSLLALGLLLSLRRQVPMGFAALLAGGFAWFHGAAHGSELSGGAALAGMLLGSATLHGLGWAAARGLAPQVPWLARAAGATVGLLGATLLLGLVR